MPKSLEDWIFKQTPRGKDSPIDWVALDRLTPSARSSVRALVKRRLSDYRIHRPNRK